jgi:hypothetical protein
VYRNWINSLGLTTSVNSLVEDCKTGIVLLEVMERLRADAVDWSKIDKRAGNKPIKVLQNCNAVVDAARGMGFSVVNFGGEDLTKGNMKQVLGLVSQMMRMDAFAKLEVAKGEGGAKKISEAQVVAWANDKAAAAAGFKLAGETLFSNQDSILLKLQHNIYSSETST